MMYFLCVRIFLNVDKESERRLLAYEIAFKKEVRRIADIFKTIGYAFEYSYRYISNDISYNSKYLVLMYAKELYLAEQRGEVYRYDYSSCWSKSSYRMEEDLLKLELGVRQRREMLCIPVYPDEHQKIRLQQGNMLDMKVKNVRNQWVAYVKVKYEENYRDSQKVMGIDLGMKVPAVVAYEDNKIRFFGNGRQIRYYQRKYQSHIKQMQKRRQFKKLRKFQHRLSHVLVDFDHKISKEIIDFAIEHDIGIMKMEDLRHINRRFQVKSCPNIYLWSYHRLQEFISYKAKCNGIRIVYVNPYNTSKKCPNCGKINKATDRRYSCCCGYHGHRDAVGAINILHAL